MSNGAMALKQIFFVYVPSLEIDFFGFIMHEKHGNIFCLFKDGF